MVTAVAKIIGPRVPAVEPNPSVSHKISRPRESLLVVQLHGDLVVRRSVFLDHSSLRLAEGGFFLVHQLVYVGSFVDVLLGLGEILAGRFDLNQVVDHVILLHHH